ncbi:hypothetical protein Tco_0391153 [Tanacetum coccineum]
MWMLNEHPLQRSQLLVNDTSMSNSKVNYRETEEDVVYFMRMDAFSWDSFSTTSKSFSGNFFTTKSFSGRNFFTAQAHSRDLHESPEWAMSAQNCKFLAEWITKDSRGKDKVY